MHAIVRIQGDISFIKLLDCFKRLVENNECSNFLSLDVSEVTSMFKATSVTRFYFHTIGAEHYHRVKFGIFRLLQKLSSL